MALASWTRRQILAVWLLALAIDAVILGAGYLQRRAVLAESELDQDIPSSPTPVPLGADSETVLRYAILTQLDAVATQSTDPQRLRQLFALRNATDPGLRDSLWTTLQLPGHLTADQEDSAARLPSSMTVPLQAALEGLGKGLVVGLLLMFVILVAPLAVAGTITVLWWRGRL